VKLSDRLVFPEHTSVKAYAKAGRSGDTFGGLYDYKAPDCSKSLPLTRSSTDTCFARQVEHSQSRPNRAAKQHSVSSYSLAYCYTREGSETLY
jgi:hypothetical protein